MCPRIRIPAGEAAYLIIGIREIWFNWKVPTISWFDPESEQIPNPIYNN